MTGKETNPYTAEEGRILFEAIDRHLPEIAAEVATTDRRRRFEAMLGRYLSDLFD